MHIAIFRNIHSAIGRMIVERNCRRFHNHRGMVCFCPEGTGNIVGNIHTIATLVVQNHAVASGGHSTVHTKGRCGVTDGSVVAI